MVFAGAPQLWSDGAVRTQSGDRGWWFDFSAVVEPGSYYIVDVERDIAGGRFEIADDVYDDVLDAALRMFWFKRANTPHPESLAGPWSDEAAYVGPGQDTEARSVDDPDNAATTLDLSGGWFDAGDTGKYVTFASEPVHQLLTAYERNPAVFDDAVGIPESGNGIADVLDEVRWEIEWLERM
jgi:endoglucanase